MRERARAVIIGGGITGCSVAYHLARAGWDDVVLIDKGPLTSGSTCHAAGLVTQFNPSPTMMRFRRYSIELYGELGVFETVGSVRIASSPESLAELQRAACRAHARSGSRSSWRRPPRPCGCCRRRARNRSTDPSTCRRTATSTRIRRPTRSRAPRATWEPRSAPASA